MKNDSRGASASTPLYQYDKDIRSRYQCIAGIDEAGRGPLAGPVVAAAVILPPDFLSSRLRDSKLTRVRERKKLFWEINAEAVAVGVGIVDADVIDHINILNATRRAMTEAVGDLGVTPDMLLIDAVTLPRLTVPQKAIVKGESVSASIAAASVVAKVVRDEIMDDYHERYPSYNFRNHKGYCTREHLERIREAGPCAIHRKSFRGVMDVHLPLRPDS